VSPVIRHARAPAGHSSLVWHGGRVCDLCIDQALRAHPTWSYEEMAWHTRHPQAHSDILECCVDERIRPFLEGFNAHVAPTWASCQGPEDAYVLLDFRHFDAVWEWAYRSGDLYEIEEVDGTFCNRVRIAFREGPDAWRG
jgi:hypothetical protein